MKLVDSLDQQLLLEEILERSKPPLPPSCAGLHWLLATPFRYGPYPHGSRFRRKDQAEGCFYGSDMPETAIAEQAFFKWLFFAESPDTRIPKNGFDHTAFSVHFRADQSVDLTLPPFDRDYSTWSDPNDYEKCQCFADAARNCGMDLIRYRSVRDPHCGMNMALLSPVALISRYPESFRTWSIFVSIDKVQAFCEMPKVALEFDVVQWAADSRVASKVGLRPNPPKAGRPLETN